MISDFWSEIVRATEFWSAILGAIVGAAAGGVIAYTIQRQALREGRQQREEDRRRVREALGNSLFFKMMRINGNAYGFHDHFEECFRKAAQSGPLGEPWQFVQPLASYPDPVHFSSEEMGMLLALKNDDVFNSVLSMDNIHNSLNDTMKVLGNERRALTDRITPDDTKDARPGAYLDRNQMLALKPQMILVNGLIGDLRSRATEVYRESTSALFSLQDLLREKLGLDYKVESMLKPANSATPVSTKS